LDDLILGKSEVIITVGWLWWCHQRAPLFSLASGPPNSKPTTACIGHASATTWNRLSPRGQHRWKAPTIRLNIKCLDLKWRGKRFFVQIGQGSNYVTR